MYDDFASLPPTIKEKIESDVEPADPEVWVKIPIQALGGRTFLDTYNSDDGQTAINAYFASVEAFEHPQAGSSVGPGVGPGAGPEDFGSVLHFDAADLDANRAGRLSQQQRTRLWHRDELQMAGAGISMVGGVGFNIALVLGSITVHGKGAGLGVTLMIVGGIFGWSSWQLWLDLASGAVASAEGPLTTTTTSTRSGMNYFFVVGGRRFGVHKAAYEQVREGLPHKVYHLRRSLTLLSLEPSS